jgi:DNA-binding IscR family transcriptional regulator
LTGYRVMDTQIFNLGLSVYATSAYIVVCSLHSDGLPASMENLSARWGATAELLDQALSELAGWLIIESVPGKAGERLIIPNPASIWRPPSERP